VNKFKKPTFPYRSDIDRLRAIAVLTVVFYHSGIIVKGNHLFDGGFFGVDIYDSLDGPNLKRVYPHETFCNINTNRCYTHN
jgi:hypothetical protein|tara:strand:+ start:900 stop:1142 length:243 start_codon:yes stop_codon:yes gene_type:complete